MLEISKFKLINGGRGGIIIKGREPVNLGNGYQVIDEVGRERKLILPDTIIAKIQQMKYYFFNCTGHWMTPFTNYYDMVNHELKPIELDGNNKIKSGQELLKNLWNKTEITGIVYKNGGFIITGTIEAVEGKKTAINTPLITEEDDLGFYSAAVDKISECVADVINYFSTHQLPQYNPETILSEEERKGLDMKELTNLVVEKLVDRNMIMLIKDEGDQVSIPESTNGTKLHTGINNIDSDNIPVHDDNDEDESPEDKRIRENLQSNSQNNFARPASDAGFPDELKSNDKTPPNNLESLEYSSGMGLGGEEENKSDGEQWEE